MEYEENEVNQKIEKKFYKEFLQQLGRLFHLEIAEFQQWEYIKKKESISKR